MTQRKQTPDVLAEILGGGQPGAAEALPAIPAPPPANKAAVKNTAAAKKTVAKPKAPAQTGRQPAAANWQYQVVSFQEYKGWRARFVNGVEIANWTSSPVLNEYLQQIADQGWELVCAASGERLYGINDKHQLYFRRRK